jgi:hypothetical protein
MKKFNKQVCSGSAGGVRAGPCCGTACCSANVHRNAMRVRKHVLHTFNSCMEHVVSLIAAHNPGRTGTRAHLRTCTVRGCHIRLSIRITVPKQCTASFKCLNLHFNRRMCLGSLPHGVGSLFKVPCEANGQNNNYVVGETWTTSTSSDWRKSKSIANNSTCDLTRPRAVVLSSTSMDSRALVGSTSG